MLKQDNYVEKLEKLKNCYVIESIEETGKSKYLVSAKENKWSDALIDAARLGGKFLQDTVRRYGRHHARATLVSDLMIMDEYQKMWARDVMGVV